MGVFETHHAKKYVMGSRVAPQTPIPLHTTGQKRCFWIPKMVVFETHHARKNGVGSGVAPQTCIPLHTMGQKKISGYLKWWCLKHTMPKICCGFWGGAPNTHTSAHHGPEKLFLDT